MIPSIYIYIIISRQSDIIIYYTIQDKIETQMIEWLD